MDSLYLQNIQHFYPNLKLVLFWMLYLAVIIQKNSLKNGIFKYVAIQYYPVTLAFEHMT